MNQLRPALVVFIALTIITGVLYPLAVTGVAATIFRKQATGSVIEVNGRSLGSELIGQDFSAGAGAEKYLWGRLSATGPTPYEAFNAETLTGSSGSNLAPTNPTLVDNVRARIEALHAADVAAGYERPAGQLVPIDLVTSSGSGLDPHISLVAAEYQVGRIAKARAIDESIVRQAITQATDGRWLGVFGEPVVNVLKVNLGLDGANQQ